MKLKDAILRTKNTLNTFFSKKKLKRITVNSRAH